MKLNLCVNCYKSLKPFVGLDFIEIKKQEKTDLCNVCGEKNKSLGSFEVDTKEWRDVIAEIVEVY